MKRILALLFALLVLTGCSTDNAQENTITTISTEEVVAEAATVSETESSSEEHTEESTEVPTAAETEAPTEPETTECKHEYTSNVTTASTCTTDGIKTYTCKYCGYAYTENIAATHDYECSDTRPATCSNTGDKTFTCKTCGNSYKETLPKNEHKWSEWTVTIEPTTTSYGKKVRTCELCHGAQEANIDPLPVDETEPVHQHSYTSKITKAATCTTDGVKTYTCSCGASYTETIAKTGHNWELYYSTATCSNGGTAHYTCACGATYEKEVPKNDHVWGEWVVTKEPTTTECGYKWRTCQLCNGGQQATIDPLPADDGGNSGDTGGNTGNADCANGKHNWVKIVDEEATCSSTGRYHSECSVCGEPGFIGTIGMTDCEYSEWSEWVQGEHEKTRTKTCVNCGHTVTESIQTSHDCSKDGHTMSEADKAKCENHGKYYHVTCICGEFRAIEKTPEEAYAKLAAHGAEKKYSDCGTLYGEGWRVKVYVPAFTCTSCGASAGNYAYWEHNENNWP